MIGHAAPSMIRAMHVFVNGERQELPADGGKPTVRDLVAQMGLSDQPVAVEVNEQVVPKRRHPERELEEGDRVEVVTLVGGG